MAGAGIGGGDRGSGGTVTIYDGVVIAAAGGKGANAFGKGDGGSGDGSLTVYDEAQVSYGNSSGGDMQYEGIAAAADRVALCLNRDYARVEPCDHGEGALTYTISDKYHTAHCAHCLTVFGTKSHRFDEENRCVDCGYQSDPAPADTGSAVANGDTGSVFGSGGAVAAIAVACILVAAGIFFGVTRKRKKNQKEE